ncbi:MAG TPA: hypothetical protein VGW38_01510 [Chloroflexota bacterium]|nr:hypothetical protein [Chloroflexota bacterium]
MKLGHLVKRVGMLVIAAALVGACKRGPTEPEGEVPTLPPVAPGTDLFMDDFDSENGRKGVYNWSTFQNWNVQEGCVDLHGNGFDDVQPGRGLYVDLDGTCGQAGTIETKSEFNLAPGNYVLEFWLAGNSRRGNRDTVDVNLGTLYQERFILTRNDPFVLRTKEITVETATPARLRFKHSGGDHFGMLLDLVRLRRAE